MTEYNPAKIGTVSEGSINAWRDEPRMDAELLKVRTRCAADREKDAGPFCYVRISDDVIAAPS